MIIYIGEKWMSDHFPHCSFHTFSLAWSILECRFSNFTEVIKFLTFLQLGWNLLLNMPGCFSQSDKCSSTKPFALLCNSLILLVPECKFLSSTSTLLWKFWVVLYFNPIYTSLLRSAVWLPKGEGTKSTSSSYLCWKLVQFSLNSVGTKRGVILLPPIPSFTEV